jgi:outer membrane receptor for Fe3+-dicitrate
MIPFALKAQISVSGTVLDANNDPLPGVNVVQTGSTNGTITDLDGKYTINVPSDATLTFSYIGFNNHVENVNGRTSIPPITLESDDKEIEQVVVVGYGTQRKSDLTGSVASVGTDDLKNRSTTDAAAALQGKVSGVQILNNSGAPGEGAKIRVRGYSSNDGNIGPLLIVDGLKVDNIQYLDPSMIHPWKY